MKKPIILDTEWVRPHAVDGVSCLTCDAVAKWIVGKPPNNCFSCAKCFLQLSPWGKREAARIMEFIIEVELSMGRRIMDNGIVLDEEADRILSSIVAISGIARSRARKQMKNEDTRSGS